jgi:hypothetical protein
MTSKILTLSFACVLLPACAKPEARPAHSRAEQQVLIPIDEEQALEIARRDASLAYRDLDAYDVRSELRGGNWSVDYQLRDKQAQGGGPHYVISAQTGAILSKRYEQ